MMIQGATNAEKLQEAVGGGESGASPVQRIADAGLERLLAYLCDMILEEQLKLGYEPETIRFYLPVSSVGHILCPDGDPGCMEASWREAFCGVARETLGAVEIRRCSGNRICFVIPPEGAAYVHEHRTASPFLAELVACFSGHGVTQEQVRELFLRASGTVRRIEITSDEFDEVWYFPDGVPDRYRYCVKYDAGHASYHRFLEEDFAELFPGIG